MKKMKHESESRIMSERLYDMIEAYLKADEEIRLYFFSPILMVSEEILMESEARLNGRIRDRGYDCFVCVIRHEENMELLLLKKGRMNRKMMRYTDAHTVKEDK